ncbi:hypothetical protein GCM10029976_042480 [Kribbella albertanoniae]|uniref:Uncharacterized protein n=1 Tax=Kribbella albertanoniae TaxID=1266829 RepID=A0A4R4QFP2_9ACTN|nr:hypothetical protein [Kribbella albertanoniae]TDC34033.1 hypothetical protein E1261_04825 [Kribbella albertanoniae]
MTHSAPPEPEHPDGVISRPSSVLRSSTDTTDNDLKPRLADFAPGSPDAFLAFDWRVLDDLASVPIEPDETEAEAAARRAIDIQLLAFLTDGRLTGDDLQTCYKKVCRRLSAHAYQVLVGWAKTGQIFTKCGTSMTPIMHPHPGWSNEDIDMVVKDTVIETARTFKTAGLRAWDPDGGRSPQSFFIEHCTQNFPRIYNRWLKEHIISAELHHLGDDEPGFDQLPGQAPDPVDVAACHDQIDRAISELKDPQLREFVGLQAVGYEPAEARNLAGLTRKAESYRLAKYRRHLEGDSPPSPASADSDDRA